MISTSIIFAPKLSMNFSTSSFVLSEGENLIKKADCVDLNDPMTSFESLESIFEKYIPEKELAQVKRVMYGKGSKNLTGKIPNKLIQKSDEENFEIKHFDMTGNAIQEQTLDKRITRIGVIQNSITDQPIETPSIYEQKKGIMKKIESMINTAGDMNVNVLCLQEAWTMPFAFCTREKYPWMEFAEEAECGESTQMIKKLAKKHNMVIISPILERDVEHAGTIWNTAVVIGNHGNYIGKQRKNHIPRVGDFNEANYYLEGNTGHPVFDTSFGKIAINICYGRHHPLNWMMFGLNGAEIVFNPSATVGALSEPLWPIEARCAAIANSYFSVGINRVGTEYFPNEFSSGDGNKAHKDFGHFYGSSYVAGPDGARTPSSSRLVDGLLVTDVDLNQCKQVRDVWTFQNAARFDMYAKKLNDFIKSNFKRQIVKDPALKGIQMEDQEFQQQTYSY